MNGNHQGRTDDGPFNLLPAVNKLSSPSALPNDVFSIIIFIGDERAILVNKNGKFYPNTGFQTLHLFEVAKSFVDSFPRNICDVVIWQP